MKLDLSIRERLAIGFGPILCLLLMLLGITFHKLHHLDLYEGQLDIIAERADEAVTIQTSFMNESIAIHSFIATRDPAYLVTFRTEKRFEDDALDRLQQLPKASDGLEIFSRIIQASLDFERQVNAIIPLVENGGNPQDLLARENNLRELRTRLIAATREFTRLQGEKRNRTVRDVEGTRGAIIQMLLVFAACIFAISFVAAVLTTCAIRRPARLLVEAIGALEHNQYGPALELATRFPQPPGGIRNELHRVAGTFGRMAAVMRRREARLAADNRLTAALASTLDPRRLTAESLREVLDFTRAAAGAVYVIDPDQNTLYRAAAHPVEGLPEWLDPCDAPVGQAFAQGGCLRLRELPPDSPWRLLLTAGGGVTPTLFLMPLLFQKRPLGVILLGADAEMNGNEVALDFLEHASRHLSVSLQNALTHAGATRLAEELGIKNRQLELQNEMLQAQGDQLKTQRARLQEQNEEIREQSEEILARNEALHRQTSELASANGLLADADRRKDEFLAMLAHELRNPLAAITNANFVLDLGSLNPEQGGRMRAVITRQLRHLSRLVDDLLDVSRITRGKVELRREILDLGQSVRHVAEACQALLDKSQQQLQLVLPAGELIVAADPTRLEQMISNLLHNASKYSEPQSRILLSVEPEGDGVLVRVRDSGIGIAPEVLPHVFELFAQADSGPDRAKGGLGIGLTMVRALAEMHGGSVAAFSGGIGRGSEFVLRLPLVNPQSEHEGAAIPPPAEAI